MSTAMGYCGAMAGVVQRDAARYLSYRMRFFTDCLSALFSVILFYYVSRLISVESFGTPDRYFEFALIGLVIMQTVTGTIGLLPGSVRVELVAGTFEALVLSPFGAVAGVLSMVIFPFLRSFAIGIVMILFAIVAFGLRLEWDTALLALPVAALGALAFTPVTVLFTAAVFAFKQAPGLSLVVAGISLLTGLYFPVTLLPEWVQWVSDVQPFTPAVDLLRHVLVGAELRDAVWLQVVRLVGFTLVLLPITVVLMNAALRFGQRRGTVTEF